MNEGVKNNSSAKASEMKWLNDKIMENALWIDIEIPIIEKQIH